MYMYILFHILFPSGLSQDIEYSSLCSSVGPCLSILYIIARICWSQTPTPPLPSYLSFAGEAWDGGRGGTLLRSQGSAGDLLRTGSYLRRWVRGGGMPAFQKEILGSVCLSLPLVCNLLFHTLIITSALLWPDCIPPHRFKSAPINLCDFVLFFLPRSFAFGFEQNGDGWKNHVWEGVYGVVGRAFIDVWKNISLW